MIKELEVMIPDIEGWAIVKYTGILNKDTCNEYTKVEVYAEHIDGCREEWDRVSALWCWQAEDGELGLGNLCWQCKEPVPDSVVGLVALAEWE